MPALLATVLQLSPLTTRWNLLQFVAMPVWYGVGVEMPSPVVVEVGFVLVVVVKIVLDVLDFDEDEVVVVLVTKVDEVEEEEVVLDAGGAGFNVDMGIKLTCTQ